MTVNGGGRVLMVFRESGNEVEEYEQKKGGGGADGEGEVGKCV